MDYEAVRLHINNYYTDIPLDKFLAFKYIIDTIDMYNSAQLLINYNGRPDYGTNLYEFTNTDSNTTSEVYDEPVKQVEPRDPFKKRSIFSDL